MLFIFLPAILIPACASSSPAVHMVCPSYKLNKLGVNIQPWHTPFPIRNQSVVLCVVITVVSLPAYRFLRRQVRWSGIPISWRISHSLLISTVKGFGIVNEADVDVFLEFSCFVYIQQMLAIRFLVPLPFLNPTRTLGSSWFMYYWSLAWRILSITLLACEISTIVQ